MTKTKKNKPTISEQLAILDEAIAFIEETPDIDAAIDRYESALTVSNQLASELQARALRIETIQSSQISRGPV